MKTKIKFYTKNKTLQILSFSRWDINTAVHCNRIAMSYENELNEKIKWTKI